jgi:hypothetical protein
MAAKGKKTTSRPSKTTRTARVQSAPRQEKPVFRTGTWVTLLVFLAIVGAMFYMNRQSELEGEATETPAAEEAFLFEQESKLTSLEIQDAAGASVKIERNEADAWVLSKPDKAEADPGASEAAATQVGTLRIITPIEKVDDPSIFGFVEPAYLITLEFEDGTKSILKVGDKTPTESGYYVWQDDDKAYVVAISGIDALNNLLSAPPYLNTPTPSPTATPQPTETPAPATETSTTPEATPTP